MQLGQAKEDEPPRPIQLEGCLENIMKCCRCGGLMVYENFCTLEIANLHEWRCVPCGEIIDKVILENRSMQGGRNGRKVGRRSQIPPAEQTLNIA